MSNYHLPDFLPYCWKELNYGTKVHKFNKHAELLDRQVLFSELFTIFFRLPELSSFYLEVETINHKPVVHENEFIKFFEEPIYTFKISNIIINDIAEQNITNLENTKKILETSISSFENYLNCKEQEKVLSWLWKRGKEANLASVKENKLNFTYIFQINKELSVQLCEDAYKENYAQFQHQVLESIVPNKKSNEVKLKKKL